VKKEKNQAVRESLFKAYRAGDQEAVRACLAPDFVLYESKGHAFAGTYKGAEGFFEFMKKSPHVYAIESIKLIREYWCEDPDYAVFEQHNTGTVKATGEKFDTTLLEYWHFHDGKVATVKPFWLDIPGCVATKTI